MTATACLERELSPRTDAGIFLGMRPSRTDGDRDYGHVWLVLGDEAGACGGPACRFDGANVPMAQPVERWIGYYPDLSELPAEIINVQAGEAVRAFFQYFVENPVPGVKRVDHRARLLATRFPERIAWVGVFGGSDTLAPAADIALIAGGTSEPQGRYGLDTSQTGVNNCVSWAAGVVNPALPPPSRFIVDNPPKVRSFMSRPENMYCRYAPSETHA